MTKYVLNSGGMKNNPDGAKRFFAELVKGLGNQPKILLCFFAQPREIWEAKFPEYVEAFNGLMPKGVNPIYEIALPRKFKDQVAKTDIVYCHGGDDNLAKYWLEKVGVPEVWDGKVIGTNSATTHALSTSFWTCDSRTLDNGLGVLPIKTIAHFGSAYVNDDPRGAIDWQKVKNDLDKYGNTNLPVYALPEGEFVVVEQ